MTPTSEAEPANDRTDTIAAAIHETWRALARAEGWQMQPHLDRPFAELAPPDQEDNRAAARRMADVLSVAGLTLTTSSPSLPTDQVQARIEAHIEAMAEAEHDGWMAQRKATGWTWAAERDDSRKRHPAMIPYADLPDREKNKDRNSVRHYPDFAQRAGHGIAETG